MIIQREKFADSYSEILPIAQEGFEGNELHQDKIPFNIDIEKMIALEETGHLVLFVGRFAGDLVAYSIFILADSLHSKDVKYAYNDEIYVNPEFRGRPAIEMLNICEEQLKDLGIQVIVYRVKSQSDLGSILARKGFEMDRTSWQKVL